MESKGEKKIQDDICWSSEMSARGNFPNMVEISKNSKKCVVSNFSAPNAVRSSRN